MTSCPIPPCPCKKSLSIFLVGHLQVLEGCCKVPPQPSLLQDEQPQLPQPLLTGEVLHPSYNFCGPSLHLLQQVCVFSVLRVPELDAVLQVGSHQSRVEGQNLRPWPAGHVSFDVAQNTVGFLGCKHTTLACVELLANQHFQAILLSAALNPFSSQTVLVLGIAPTHVQNIELGLAELHEVHMGSRLKPVQVPLDGIPSLQCVDHTTQLGVVSKLSEGVLNPTVRVIDKDVKKHPSRCWPLRNTTHHRIIESLKLEKTSKVIRSSRPLNTTMPTNSCPELPYLHVFGTPPGMMTPPSPWEGCSSAWLLFQSRNCSWYPF